MSLGQNIEKDGLFQIGQLLEMYIDVNKLLAIANLWCRKTTRTKSLIWVHWSIYSSRLEKPGDKYGLLRDIRDNNSSPCYAPIWHHSKQCSQSLTKVHALYKHLDWMKVCVSQFIIQDRDIGWYSCYIYIRDRAFILLLHWSIERNKYVVIADHSIYTYLGPSSTAIYNVFRVYRTWSSCISF